MRAAAGFFDEMALRRAREQQQQVDAGGGQAASQTTGRRQVEFEHREAVRNEAITRAVRALEAAGITFLPETPNGVGLRGRIKS